MTQKLLKEFKSPGSKYRATSFWAWNGKLVPEELRRQMRIMHSMGLGGILQFTYTGLDTVYLSDEWFECIKTCIDEAEKLDMQVWLDDEDRWPSGYAGGLVTKKPKYRMRSLVMEEVTDTHRFSWSKDVLAAFTAKVDRTAATNVKRLRRGQRPGNLGRNELILVFRIEVDSSSPNYNDQTYVDTMNPEAIRNFIKLTHEAYRKRIGRHFGKRVRGFFTDGPYHGKINTPYYGEINKLRGKGKTATAWTDRLPAIFKKRYGYDLLEHLPELFFDVDRQTVSRTRYYYHHCITHLFVDGFAGQIGRWCEKNRMQLAGHASIATGTLGVQTREIGSFMRFLEHQEVPTMDILTEYRRSYDVAKMVSSIGHQFGRKWRLTETYGCTGWAFSFAGHKAIGDWQAALGINLRTLHIAWYTMEGRAKRDYPACISYQSPWWPYYRKVEDYFARIHAVMSRGRDVRDLLVIHPNESMWTLFNKDGGNAPEVCAYDAMFGSLRDSLLAENIDFDYGDEDILARHAKVGRKNGEDFFRIGNAAYKAVIVPPLKTMRLTTLQLLKRFNAAGGKVVFAGEVARYVDAVPSDAVVLFALSCTTAMAKGKKLVQAVESQSRRINITGPNGQAIRPALHLLKEDKDAFYLFVCNTGHDFSKNKFSPAVDVPVRLRKDRFEDVRIHGFIGCAGAPIELNPDTGEIFSATAKYDKDSWEICTSLPRLGSRLFIIPKNKQHKMYPARKQLKDVRKVNLGKSRWDISLSENNVLVLDMPRFKIGSGHWRTAPDILRVDDAVRDVLGLSYRRDEMVVQPYARKRSSRPRHVDVTLVYTFNVSAVPSGDLFLGLERPETFQIEINGTSVSVDAECGWWCDRSLRKIPIEPALLRFGTNQITLTLDYDEDHPGLEIIYLLGSFGVQVKGADVTITEQPKSLKTGDWVKMGLAFYSGSVCCRRTIRPKIRKNERLFVQVPAYQGVAVRVLVNGRHAGIIAWEPNEVDITDFVDGSQVDLQIEVISHRRNSHGPLHLTDKSPFVVSPDEFVSEGDRWSDRYQMVPCGLMKSPQLVVRE